MIDPDDDCAISSMALADSPYFDIDKNNITATLISFTTSRPTRMPSPRNFSMHLKLKTPISLRPQVEAGQPSASQAMKKLSPLSGFDIGVIIAFVVVALLGGAAWWFLRANSGGAGRSARLAKADYRHLCHGESLGHHRRSALQCKGPPGQYRPAQGAARSSDPAPNCCRRETRSDVHEKEDPVAWKHDLDDEVNRLNDRGQGPRRDPAAQFLFRLFPLPNQSPSDEQTAVLNKQLAGHQDQSPKS